MAAIYVLASSFVCSIAASGIGAAITQRINNQYSFLFALIAVVVTSVMLRDYYRHKNCGLIVLASVCLTLLHPFWTISGNSGDMGMSQKVCSLISTTIIVSLLITMYFSRQNWRSLPEHSQPSIDPSQSTD